ncbi:type VI secretion system ATPase TssH [Inquilinus sp. NPDC058860]|uniref:type VI secretion system ATPase TssH n=1 Tax=Inquilinus sp. NPDC058860 TaxID=3346652 RepID=UPI0036D12E9A
MAAIDLKSLIGRLNPECRRALEEAAGLTLSRSHFNVEIEHWLLKLLEDARGDIGLCLAHYEIDAGRVAADLTRALDRLKTGNVHPPALSPSLISLGREAWLLASLEYGEPQIRSGHLLAALVSDDLLAQHARTASSWLGRIPAETLRRELPRLVAGASETPPAPAAGEAPASAAAGRRTEALDRYTTDLTARARAGGIDPILGRDAEIRQVTDILMRRRQNNPILTGEAGVGKTAVVEGFALRIAGGDVPEPLREVTLRTLDLGLLQAGAGVRGEFENRLKSVIEEVQASPTPIILFIDEAHTMIGAGGPAGQSDAANLLKPALARGELRTIAATTWSEYKRYVEKDAALSRRFQVVKVEEPSEDAAIDMMRGIAPTLEQHHGVRILDEAIVGSVRLSHRYIVGRQLPDKSVSLLDTACARVAMAQATTPAAIEDLIRQRERLDAEIAILRREQATSADDSGVIAALEDRRRAVEADHARLSERWQAEREAVERIRELRARIEAASGLDCGTGEAAPAELPETVAALRAGYAAARARLTALQEDAGLNPVDVDAQTVAEVVASWTGIPVGRMVSDEIRAVLTLKDRMRDRIVGQDHALEAVAQSIRTARAKLTDPRKPIGVFLFVGMSGVGKTETALALADLLFGGEHTMTVINMSEFKEEHKVSLLLGAPPGYVGYGEGGILTEAVRRRPYSVVLLDELEKAHPGVQDVFYQVFDKGMLRDGEGRDIDFKNTVVILTSNVGSDRIAKLHADPDTMPDATGLAEALRPELLAAFKPAFLGRVTVIPFLPLGEDTVRRIVRLQLDRVARRVSETYGATLRCDDGVVEGLRARATENESGARAIEQILSRTLLPDLAAQFLTRASEGEPIADVTVAMDAAGGFQYRVAPRDQERVRPSSQTVRQP